MKLHSSVILSHPCKFTGMRKKEFNIPTPQTLIPIRRNRRKDIAVNPQLSKISSSLYLNIFQIQETCPKWFRLSLVLCSFTELLKLKHKGNRGRTTMKRERAPRKTEP
mmetsp:Transcript_16783/g.25116  ORF Transcript_16783/g.25116 Transcript_16783/m.25116 type:complete len:108 (-) Transcript_16783:192-515(-)